MQFMVCVYALSWDHFPFSLLELFLHFKSCVDSYILKVARNITNNLQFLYYDFVFISQRCHGLLLPTKSHALV